MTGDILLDRIRGGLYGAYIGDTMGAVTEMMTKEEIRDGYGLVEEIIGGGWLDIKPGDPTDDTEMSLIIMKVLEETGEKKLFFKRRVAEGFLSWLESEPKDVGNQIYEALSYYRNHSQYIPVDEEKQGNGSLMRALPCALYGSLDYSIAQSEITHPASEVTRIIMDYYSLVQSLLDGTYTPKGAYSLMEPTGFIKNTYNNALYYLESDTFEESITGPVNDGGDADTIASIAGGLSGIRFGYNAIPPGWLRRLRKDVTDILDSFALFALQRRTARI